jgi:hypothetical protein
MSSDMAMVALIVFNVVVLLMVGVIGDAAVSRSCFRLNQLCSRNHGDIVRIMLAFI